MLNAMVLAMDGWGFPGKLRTCKLKPGDVFLFVAMVENIVIYVHIRIYEHIRSVC